MGKDGLFVSAPQEACLPLERLDRNDAKVLLIWILAGLVGACVAYAYFFQAFPEASVEFKVPRADALAMAKQFAATQGAQLGGYDSSIVFEVDDEAKTYLEREVGLQQANRMMTNEVHIWYWQTRFFRPLQKEEFDVRVDPAGNIVGYLHELEETAPGARLERAAAQDAAEYFLRDTLHRDLSLYDFREEEANPTERPARRDWSFSWERRGFRAKDAPYRLTVTLAGDIVGGYSTLTGDRFGGYSEYLKVPEAWSRDYEHLRSSNNLLEFIALLPYAFLIGGCLSVIISLGRRDLLEWRTGFALGIFLTVLFFLMTMNQWPLDRAEYDTNTPYSSFFLSQLGKAALLSITSALLAVIAIVPGEPLYRLFQPDKLRLDVGLRLAGIRTKEFFRANVIGICLAAAHIGYITVFYIISRKLGAWAPQDLNYENVVSTYVPWVYPLTIGIYAATSEEFLFRLFAIPFLLRMTKSRVLAVVLPAFFWGFLHVNYPQEPAYIRGLEIGLIGIVAGLVMLRWGIWATLIWHYTVDAFLISTSLLRSHGAYLRFSGAIVGGAALIHLAIAAISYVSRGGFVSDAALLNSATPLDRPRVEASHAETPQPAFETTTTVAAPDQSAGYAAMSSRALAILIACGLAGIALLAGVKRETIGDFVRFSINAHEAIDRANEDMRQLNLDPATYHRAATVTYTFDEYTNEYLRRTIGIAAANRVYRELVPSAFWTVRYFRDSQNEEYTVVLKPDGSLHSVHHTLEEKAQGANLSKEAQARAIFCPIATRTSRIGIWSSRTPKEPARADHFWSGNKTPRWMLRLEARRVRPSQPRGGRAHPHAATGARRRSFRLPDLHQDSRKLARHGKPHHAGANRAVLWQGCGDRSRIYHRPRDFLPQPEKSRGGPGSMAPAGKIVHFDATGGDGNLRQSVPTILQELPNFHAAGDLLYHSLSYYDFRCGHLHGRRRPLARAGLVFPGADVWPRMHSILARIERRILPRRSISGAFWLLRSDGTGSSALAARAVALVPPRIGHERS